LKSKSEYLSDEAWQCSDGDYVDLSNLLSSDALITAVYSHGYFTHCRLQMYLGKVHLRTWKWRFLAQICDIWELI